MAADGINIRIRWSDKEPDSHENAAMYITNHTIPFGGPLPPGLQEPPLDYPYFESMEFELVDTGLMDQIDVNDIVDVLTHEGNVGFTGEVIASLTKLDGRILWVRTQDGEEHQVNVSPGAVQLHV